jgi:hypothetical protein
MRKLQIAVTHYTHSSEFGAMTPLPTSRGCYVWLTWVYRSSATPCARKCTRVPLHIALSHEELQE